MAAILCAIISISDRIFTKHDKTPLLDFMQDYISLARNQKLSRSRNWKRQGKAGEVVKETVAFLALQSVSAFLSLSLS